MTKFNGGSDVPSSEIVDELFSKLHASQKDFYEKLKELTILAHSKGYTVASFDPCPNCLEQQSEDEDVHAALNEWVHSRKLFVTAQLCNKCTLEYLASDNPNLLVGSYMASMLQYPLEDGIWQFVVQPDGTIITGEYINGDIHQGIVRKAKERIRQRIVNTLGNDT